MNVDSLSLKWLHARRAESTEARANNSCQVSPGMNCTIEVRSPLDNMGAPRAIGAVVVCLGKALLGLDHSDCDLVIIVACSHP